MPQEEINIIQQILSMGLPGILLIFCVILWRALVNEIRDHKETLKEIGMVRQKREEVEALAETWKNRQSVKDAGTGI